MPQNEYIERWQKLSGKRLDFAERKRKREAREQGRTKAQEVRGLKAKLHHEARRKEKIQLKKRIRQHDERNVKSDNGAVSSEPLPPYLLDRKDPSVAKALSSSIKDRRKEQSARFSVPLPRVKGISEADMFSVMKTGKTKRKAWKRVITKPTFVGEGFTRPNVKYERFIRPTGLRCRTAHVSHPELGITVKLPILGVKKNPQDALYTRLGVLTKGTIIEVNVSELGITTSSGKVAWGRYAQITNDPENDGTVNAVLLI